MSLLEAAVDYEVMGAEALVARVLRDAPAGSVCFTSSFQTEDMVVLHMLRRHLAGVPVIFLETGYHFKELIAYRDRMVAEWGLNLVNAMPSTTVPEFEGQFGKLHIVQPTECCRIRKVEPLMRSLEPFDWWFTGLRREQSPTRAGLKKVEDHRTPTGKQMKKVSVLADWDWARVSKYAETEGIPRLELYDRGIRVLDVSLARLFPRRGLILGVGAGEGRNWSVGSILFRKKVRGGFCCFWACFGGKCAADVVF